MPQRLFLLISSFLLHCLLIKCEQLIFPSVKIDLDFYYTPAKSRYSFKIPVTTFQVLRRDAINTYILRGDLINEYTLAVRAFRCMIIHCSCGNCGKNFDSSHIMLQHIMPTDLYVLRIEEKHRTFIQLLRNLSSQIISAENNFNLTCVLPTRDISTLPKPKDPHDSALSNTSLFGIIFLGACVLLVVGLCIGWFAVIYYRRFIHQRMEEKLRTALAKSTQQLLDKSPIVIFDSNNKDNDMLDDESVCAVCLEPFQNKEKIRKLVCSHYFHVICIDPWLLSHQSCPLCNRNILRNSIPSISSSITMTVSEQSNDGTTLNVNNNNNNQIN